MITRFRGSERVSMIEFKLDPHDNNEKLNAALRDIKRELAHRNKPSALFDMSTDPAKREVLAVFDVPVSRKDAEELLDLVMDRYRRS